MSITEEKKAIRQEMMRRRAAMPFDVHAEADAAICANVLASDAFQRAKTVFLYVAMPHEVGTKALMQACLDTGRTLALPVCNTVAHTMIFYRLEAMDELRAGAYRIPIPPVAEDRICIPDAETLMLLPMMAYDKEGYRLGAGGGYYDRYLAQYPALQTLGLCYAECTVDALPRDAYDRTMIALATENGMEDFHGEQTGTAK